MGYVNAHRAPVDLASGRVLAPGESVPAKGVDPKDPHDAALIADGKLLEASEQKSAQKPEEG